MGDLMDGGFNNQRDTARRKVSELLDGIESPTSTSPVTVSGNGNSVVIGQLTIVCHAPGPFGSPDNSIKARLRAALENCFCLKADTKPDPGAL